MTSNDLRATSSRVQTRQLDLLYAYSRLPQWLILLSAVGVVLVMWPHAPHNLLLGWLAVISSLALLRAVLVRHYRDSTPGQRQQRRWYAFFYLGNLASGFSLAFVHIYIVPLDNFELQAVTYALASGIALCVSIIYATQFVAFLSFTLPAWLPPTLYLLWQDDQTSPYWGVMGITLFGCILLAAAFLNRTATAIITANERNKDLVLGLDEAKQQSEELNRQLTREINHRRLAERELRQSHEALEQRVADRTAALQATSERLEASEARLNLAIEASQLGLWDWNLDTDEVYHSHLEEIFGLSGEAVTRMLDHLTPLVHPDDRELVRSTLIQHMQGSSKAYRIEYRVRHADGHWVWVEDSGRAVEWDARGRVTRMIGTRRDVSERLAREQQAQLAATVFDATAEGIFILDPGFHILTVNQAFSFITGYAADDLCGSPMHQLSEDPDRNRFYQHLKSTLDSEDRWQGELMEQRRSGERYPQWLQLTVVRNPQGQITHYVGFFSDQTSHRQTEQRLQYLANFDPLTQLANRNLFTQQLEEAVSRARQFKQDVALLHVDLDRFKHINDTLGHHIADNLLRQVAQRLVETAGDSAATARLSADEFVLIVEGNLQRSELSQLAEHLLQNLRRPVNLEGHELVVSASVGISLFPHTARDGLLLITQANQAMQHAKYLGGDGYQFYSDNLQTHGIERLQLENQLRKALDDAQLVVYYQPKQDLPGGALRSAEALVRWQHPQHGLLAPAAFIELAEETGMIVRLGEQVLQQACAQASQWYQNGQPMQIAVNLSVQQLRQRGFAEQVAAVLLATELPAHYLQLELTESMLLEQLDVVEQNIAALRALGVSLAIDDFGTGYSSLAYLKRFPIDTLKIDRTFIAGLQQGAQDAAIVRAIIVMGHSLGLQVVAEGVEDEAQRQLLRDYQCDQLQGYLIGRPMPANELTPHLARELPIDSL
ncbi:GGDEF domain-containing phosphodiesterase [Halopseudomonas salegens]|uniref:cyclic-guanylate-specific phosphodiesterase n=1 Tax=Halopseudomonas salegens TaxID=1434072 RepID=A0A1H2HQC7_9GAMM|nr:GGDEF domain-containing phosphodiesterase [Halopseudomonas salegens]SDU34072.1 diguanylate cyclase/phosphodiesterase with PAS/PAC sensor(s) [Halopseudomonas salegens]